MSRAKRSRKKKQPREVPGGDGAVPLLTRAKGYNRLMRGKGKQKWGKRGANLTYLTLTNIKISKSSPDGNRVKKWNTENNGKKRWEKQT